MKRFAIVLLFLLAVAGVVFFFGWIQIRIPADGYGVIFSRTSGWEDEVVRPGAFVWRWQRLIPTNLTLYVFEPEEHRTDARLEGELPSNGVITAILDETSDFTYDVRLTIVTRIRPEELPALTRDEGLRPEDLEEYYAGLDAQISQLATEAVMDLVASQPDSLSMDAAFTSVVENVTQTLERRLTSLDILSIAPQRIELPDMTLYLEARRQASDVLQARAQAIQQAAAGLAQTQAETDRNLQLLERYGQILDRYPVLLEYFRVGQEIEGDPLNLEEIIPDPAQ